MARISSYPIVTPKEIDTLIISQGYDIDADEPIEGNPTGSVTIGSVIDLVNTGLVPGTGTVTSLGVSMPSAFTVSNSPVTSAGVINITGSGTSTQYIDGTGSLQLSPNQSLNTTDNVVFNSIAGDGALVTNIDKYTTSYIDSNIYTKTEADGLFSSGFVGAISPTSPAPTQNGLYSCTQSGTYTNFGGEVVSLSNQVVSIAVEGAQNNVFSQIITPTGITFDSTPTLNSTNAVESGGVYDSIEDIKEYQSLSFQTFTGGFYINSVNKTFTASGRFFFHKNSGVIDSTINQVDVPFDVQEQGVFTVLFNPTTEVFRFVRFDNSTVGTDWFVVGSVSNDSYLINGNYSVDGIEYFNGNLLKSDSSTGRDSNYSVYGWGGDLVIDTTALTVEVTGQLFVSFNGGFIDVTNVQSATAFDGGNLTNGLNHILINKTNKQVAVVHYTNFGNYSNSEWILLGTYTNGDVNLKGVCVIDGIKYINGIAQAVESVSYKSETSLGNVDYQGLGTDYSHIIFYGQSLSMGWEADVALTTSSVSDTFMLGDRVWIDKGNPRTSVLSPLISTKQNSSVGESPAVSSAHVFKDLINKYHWLGGDTEVVATNCGEGGKSIEQLSKENTNGVVYYDTSFIPAIDLMKTVADNNSKSVSCPAIIWMQGESNYSGSGKGLTTGTDATVDKAQYKTYLSTLKDNMQTDIMSTYSQSKKPLFFIYQVAGSYIDRVDMSINMAQIEFAEENNDVVLLNPTYGLPDYSGGHLSSNGYRWYGELIAKDLYNSIINGKDLFNTKVENVRIIKNIIYLDCSVYASPLVIDTKTVEEKDSYGFLVGDSLGANTISSVEIIGGATIKLTLSRNISSSAYVSYAGNLRNGTGNVRDSHKWVSKYNYADETSLVSPSYTPLDENGNNLYGKKYPCYNWLSAFYKELN